MELLIPKVDDFDITGDGNRDAWDRVDWQRLTRVGSGTATYETRAKALYSDAAIYFLTDCEDSKLTCTLTQDGLDIWNEDVVEIFLWPDEAHPVYFEYEISPLGCELALLVSNTSGVYGGWSPWHYDGDRSIAKATSVRGGEKASMAKVSGWTAECRIPFALLSGLSNMPPVPGAAWRGNIFRMDYDVEPVSQWAWCPDTGGKFHNIDGFGTFRFV